MAGLFNILKAVSYTHLSHLYIRSITLCVAASLVLSLPVIIGSLTAIFLSLIHI